MFDEYLASDDALYHFTKTKIFFESIVDSNKFNLYPVKTTDDPREYKYWQFTEVSYGDSFTEKEDSRSFIEKNQLINKLIKERSFISCFCENNKVKIEDNQTEKMRYGFEKSRMWSQYADHHYGLCLVISKTKIKEIIDKYDRNDFLVFHNKMKYQYEFQHSHDYNSTTFIQNTELNSKNSVLKHIEYNHENIYFTKDIDYKDESEYRIVVVDINGQKQSIGINLNEIIRGVILGDKFPDVYLPLVQLVYNEYKCNIRKIEWLKGNPFLYKCLSGNIDYEY